VILLYALILVAALVRVAVTFKVFSATTDEPAHIASGLDWLRGLPYIGDPTHPPLARAVLALPAYLSGIPTPPAGALVDRGDQILYSRNYVSAIAEARRCNLVFLILAICSVGFWGWQRLGPWPAGLAMLFFTSLPPILGHAGLATTDMAATATVALALPLFDRWRDSPSVGWGVLLGAVIGLGVASKFSFLLFFGAAAVAMAAADRFGHVEAPHGHASPRRAIFSAILACFVAAFVLWAAYRFEIGTIGEAHTDGRAVIAAMMPKGFDAVLLDRLTKTRIPAPMFFVGLGILASYNRIGQAGFLFGHISQHGWWYYFPVAIFFKTPLPFLGLAVIGAASCLLPRRTRALPIIALAMLLVVLPTSIDIGVRHVLPIYVPLSMLAAAGAVALWRDRRFRIVAVILSFWVIADGIRAHPDYVAWFNGAAGRHPERILSDSNLDWGQDYLRLVTVLHRSHADHVFILPVGSVQIWNHGVSAERIRPYRQTPGWYVLSETGIALDPEARKGAYAWLTAYPFQRVGTSIRLYHVP
jgi:hypothetical protein